MARKTPLFQEKEIIVKDEKWSGQMFPVRKSAFYQISFCSKADEKGLMFISFYNDNQMTSDADFCSSIEQSSDFIKNTYFFRSRSFADFAKISLQKQNKYLFVKEISVEEKNISDVLKWLKGMAKKISSIKPFKIKKSYLTETTQALKTGKKITVVMLGDSIVNDMSNCFFDVLLKTVYPESEIEIIPSVRNSTGCWYYEKKDRVQKYVVDYNPDLVIIGGISHKKNISSIKNVIQQIKDRIEPEIIITGGVFGENWISEEKTPDEFNVQLKILAEQQKVEFFDIGTYCGNYIKESGKPYEFFLRDRIHPNDYGRVILAYALFYFFID